MKTYSEGSKQGYLDTVTLLYDTKLYHPSPSSHKIALGVQFFERTNQNIGYWTKDIDFQFFLNNQMNKGLLKILIYQTQWSLPFPEEFVGFPIDIS